MVIINYTKLDTSKLRELFIKTKGSVKSTKLLVMIRKGTGYRGMAYNCAWYKDSGKRIYCNNAIDLWITDKNTPFVLYMRTKNGLKKYTCFDSYCLATLIFLHEVGHIKDYQKDKSSKYRQRHCDEYAIQRAKKFGLAWETDKLLPVVVNQNKSI